MSSQLGSTTSASSGPTGVDFGGGFDAVCGRSRLGVDGGMTLLIRFDLDDGSGGFTDPLGNSNFRNGFGPKPRIRYYTGATWTRGPQAANLTTRYIDSYRNDAVGTLPFIDDWMTVDAYYARQLEPPHAGGWCEQPARRRTRLQT